MAAPALAPAEVIPASRCDPALDAYEPFAPFYDRFTEETEYAKWLAAVDAWVRAEGLAGRRLLDVACGTGKSFEPMLDKGYDVTACDLSPAMVAEARIRAAGAAEVVVEDMRRLPWRSRFDLITCIDDAMNYLLSLEDLVAALTSMAAALRPGGILVFDTNSFATYRTWFADEFEVKSGPVRFRWCGEGSRTSAPGALSRATLEIAGPTGSTESRHVQRHWPIETLRSACIVSGYGRVRFRGQVTGCNLLGDPDERRHTKIVCLAVKP